MSSEEAENVFPGAGKYNRFNLGYSGTEAIAKIADYEEQKNQEEEIKVGDEVTAKTKTDLEMPKAVILNHNPTGTQYLVLKYDGTTSWWTKKGLRKTGRHFSEIAEVLQKMREKE